MNAFNSICVYSGTSLFMPARETDLEVHVEIHVIDWSLHQVFSVHVRGWVDQCVPKFVISCIRPLQKRWSIFLIINKCRNLSCRSTTVMDLAVSATTA